MRVSRREGSNCSPFGAFGLGFAFLQRAVWGAAGHLLGRSRRSQRPRRVCASCASTCWRSSGRTCRGDPACFTGGRPPLTQPPSRTQKCLRKDHERVFFQSKQLYKAYQKPGMRCCLQMASAVCRSGSADCRFGNLQTADFLQTRENHERTNLGDSGGPRAVRNASQ